MRGERTYYDVLGVPRDATQEQIRLAFRRLVLKYHPDRSGTRETTDLFMQIVEAHSVLSSPERRAHYDALLRAKDRHAQPAERPRPEASNSQQPSSRQNRPPTADLTRLLNLAVLELSRGRLDRAEAAARSVVGRDFRVALAHSILGDVYRSRGQTDEALKHYAYALQFEPENQTYQKRYYSLHAASGPSSAQSRRATNQTLPLAVACVITFLTLAYVALAKEEPIRGLPAFINTWTAGLIVMLFVCGLTMGAALSISMAVDPYETLIKTPSGRLSRAAALGLVAIMNFWASALIYVVIGVLQDAFTYSISRVVFLVAVLTACFATASALAGQISWAQTLLWGGNVLYLGVLGGWLVADAFRQ
jgi:curved DNA-binding protein CbpA